MNKEEILNLLKDMREKEEINLDIQLKLKMRNEKDSYRQNEYMYALGKYHNICEIIENLKDILKEK